MVLGHVLKTQRSFSSFCHRVVNRLLAVISFFMRRPIWEHNALISVGFIIIIIKLFVPYISEKHVARHSVR